MKLKQWFCRHRYLKALDAYLPEVKYNPNYTAVGYEEPIIVLKCERCGKIFELPLSDMQYCRHNSNINIDIVGLLMYEFFGGGEEVKRR